MYGAMVNINRLKNKVIVLDTCVFIMDYDPMNINQEQYTVPQVINELNEDSIGRLRLLIAIEQGRVKLKTPMNKYIDMIEDYSIKMGDSLFLSDVDKNILALAKELMDEGYNIILLSDDYSIQNVADGLGLEYFSLSTLGIRYRYDWEQYCPACHKVYSQDNKMGICEICGTRLRLRVKRKSRLRAK